MKTLKDKVAVVTGASGLLGREHCKALSLQGAQVVALDLPGSGVEAFASSLSEMSFGLTLDITQSTEVRSVVDEVLRRTDRIDVLINNAAINDAVENKSQGGYPFEELPEKHWDQMFEVNVKGTFLMCQAVIPQMISRRNGSIINIASTYGVTAPNPNLYTDASGKRVFHKSAAYPATKGAIIAFSRYLAANLGEFGIRVNCLSPGGVENGQSSLFIEKYSQMTPLGRMAQPNEYHGAICFLASDQSKYMTGGNLVVDGGWTAW